MPEQLEQEVHFHQILSQSRAILFNDPNGELTLPWRNSLWLAMGAYQEDQNGHPTGPGWRRRVQLSQLTIEHLLPIWQEHYPQDQGPQKMLLMAEQIVQGRADRDATGTESDNYWAGLSDLGVMEDDSEPAEVLPFLVGMAAARVVRTARLDYQMILFQNPGEIDTERDAWAWDESYLGAMAYAGGAPWVLTSSLDRRREFWQWWLDQAAPQAYQSVLSAYVPRP